MGKRGGGTSASGGSGHTASKSLKKAPPSNTLDTTSSTDSRCKYSSNDSLASLTSSSTRDSIASLTAIAAKLSHRNEFSLDIYIHSLGSRPKPEYVQKSIDRLTVLEDLAHANAKSPFSSPIKDLVFMLRKFFSDNLNASSISIEPNLTTYDGLVYKFIELLQDCNSNTLTDALTQDTKVFDPKIHTSLTQLLQEMYTIGVNLCEPPNLKSSTPSKKRNHSESSESTLSKNLTPPQSPDKNQPDSVVEMEQEDSHSQDPTPKPEIIYAKVTGDWLTFISGINAILSAPPTAVLRGDSVSLQVHNADDHFKLVDYLSLKEIQHSAPPPKNLRPKKVVLRGLPSSTNVSDIIDELAHHDLKVISAVSMLKRATKEPLNLFLLDVSPTSNLDSIYSIKYLLHLKVKFTQFRASRAPQCHACQRFFHHSNSCNFLPRCVKCGEDHTSSGCEKPRTDPAKCANCSENHTANYQGCKMNPRNRFPTKRSHTPKTVLSKDTVPPPTFNKSNFPVHHVVSDTRTSALAHQITKRKFNSYASATASSKSSDGVTLEQETPPSGDLLSVIGEIRSLCSVYKISDILILLKAVSTALQTAKSPEEKLAAIITPIFNFFNSTCSTVEK